MTMIDTDAKLQELALELKNHSEIFVDTEFHSEGRYMADLGSIQIAYDETREYFIDPIAVSDLSPLLDVFTDNNILKVFHAATQDLYILNRLITQKDKAVYPIFDTQIAASLVSTESQLSFARLVEKITKVHLEKAHSYTDWLKRPLDAGQIEYALHDVKYLIPIYRALNKKLEKLNRKSWAEEEFNRLADKENYKLQDPQTAYIKMRGAEKLKSKPLSILAELAAFREETAFKENIPPSKLFRDEVLLELARRPLKSFSAIKNTRGMAETTALKYGAQLLEIMAQKEFFAVEPINNYTSRPHNEEPLIDFLQLCLRLISEEKNISLSMLGTRNDLYELYVHNDDGKETKLLSGWRYMAAGERLVSALHGEVTARVDFANKIVKLNIS